MTLTSAAFDFLPIDLVASAGPLADGQLLVWEQHSTNMRFRKERTNSCSIALLLEPASVEILDVGERLVRVERLRAGDVIVLPAQALSPVRVAGRLHMLHLSAGPALVARAGSTDRLVHAKICDRPLRSLLSGLYELMHDRKPPSARVMEDLAMTVLGRAMQADLDRQELERPAAHRERCLSSAELARVDAQLRLLLLERRAGMVSDLARPLRLSPAYFARLFKHSTGVSIREHQLTLRLEHGIELLAAGGCSVTEAALECGLDLAQFSRGVRRRFGRPPSELRRAPELAVARLLGRGGLMPVAEPRGCKG